jgi:hypothetical protein
MKIKKIKLVKFQVTWRNKKGQFTKICKSLQQVENLEKRLKSLKTNTYTNIKFIW